MKINYKVFTALALTTMMFTSCDDGDAVVDKIVADTTRGAILRTVEITSNELPIGVDTGEFAVDLEIQSEEDGTLVSSLDAYVSFVDADTSNGPGDVAESLYTSIPSSEFSSGDRGLPTYSFSVSLGELLGVTGIDASEIDGSDQFRVRFELVLTDGRTFSFAQNSGTLTGSYFSSPFLYSATVVCPPKAPTAGEWTINMTDSYGDGWQTNTGNGGDGITVTLDDGTVLEVGLCSPYSGAAGTFLGGTDCVENDGSAGVGTITIPVGTETADWFFPGDEYGEIGFEIVTPNGNIVGGYQGVDAGPITIDFCKD